MKKDIKNSPVVAGVLILVLLISLGKTAMILMGGGAPASAAPPDGSTKPTPATTPHVAAATDKIQVTPAVDISSHDPFYHPSLAKLAQDDKDAKPKPTDPSDPHLPVNVKRHPAAASSSDAGHYGPLKTFPVSTPGDVNLLRPGSLTVNPTRNADGSPAFSNKGGSLPPMPNSGSAGNGGAKPETDLSVPTSSDSARIAAWRLKAVLRGARNVAILEGVGQAPVSVAAGDRVRGIRVVSVTAKSITLSSSEGVWMLGLQSRSNDSKADESANASSNDEGDKKQLP